MPRRRLIRKGLADVSIGMRPQGLVVASLVLLAASSCAAAAPPAAPDWRRALDPAVFAQAAREGRFVLLDVEAVWCHWCHVMDQTTYRDPQVLALIQGHYLPVKIDQDAQPALANRYGDWGWPATVVLDAKGQEIVKRRGYLPPPAMAAMLKAIVEDPTPGPSVQPATEIVASDQARLTPAQRQALWTSVRETYDETHAGFGTQMKFVDALTVELLLERATQGDAQAARMARATLAANRALLDPVWGGVYQYSATPDWRSPHYEKLMSFQADDLRLYARAYAAWRDPADLAAARAIYGYLRDFLRASSGAFYVSQDADLNAQFDGARYYALPAAERRRLGLPRIDTHLYARENGWAIAALCAYADASGQTEPLTLARRAARWVLTRRALPGGGFRHGAADRAGPYLGDTLAMGQAFLALYRSTAEREWLERADAALDFIAAHFSDPRGGLRTRAGPPAGPGALADEVRLYEENVALARLANLLSYYTGRERDRAAAAQALRFLDAPALLESGRFLPGVLLADDEARTEPLHLTVVGAKSDPAARALFAQARSVAETYARIEWWDPHEGALPNPDVRYPQRPRAALYACTGTVCSSPLYTAGDFESWRARTRERRVAQPES
jgi:uncharacterized protein YyaL (SSP411 family)